MLIWRQHHRIEISQLARINHRHLHQAKKNKIFHSFFLWSRTPFHPPTHDYTFSRRSAVTRSQVSVLFIFHHESVKYLALWMALLLHLDRQPTNLSIERCLLLAGLPRRSEEGEWPCHPSREKKGKGTFFSRRWQKIFPLIMHIMRSAVGERMSQSQDAMVARWRKNVVFMRVISFGGASSSYYYASASSASSFAITTCPK